ncbi:hypothetical protein HETIRDRAFT_423730 [Heterobasidion irregulare TC 32-1]|uniref:HNH nuclease domain-containing protein n=1 Tax=Heterobasidion irregulare (strain TC 32-1) TaxID=747525 RepID=W4KLJ1_HETIT|nr:uncharacterized protein HETIRDRAFT_423730 [Heterobasidion irregulare TC 32-1]ETW86569.1 hypothetical protein HETIRDRAFT_423730 [Heterobasidion irregulare TC 32-1]
MAPLATAAACVHPTAAAQALPAPRFETHIPETSDEDLVSVVAESHIDIWHVFATQFLGPLGKVSSLYFWAIRRQKGRTSIKDSSSTRVKSSTNGEPSVKNKLSVKNKFSIKGKLTIKRKHSFKDKPSKDAEEESMAEEDTSQSGLDDDAPTRSPLPTRSCSRNSRLTGLAYDLDDTHGTKAPNGFLNSAAVNRIDDSDYVRPQRFTLSPEERLHKIIQGASMHDGRKLTSGTDPFTKRVVDALDPHPHQCLVTRQLDTEIEVEYCHFLPQCDSKDNGFLTRLEHALGIGYKKLNIDDARNVARLLISIHRYVDKQRAMFLPTPEIVNRISHNHEIGHDIRNIYEPGEAFEYRFLPLPGNPTSDIVHYQRTDKGEQSQTPAPVTTKVLYPHPFYDLPAVYSHVEPHYVIINAARKLKDLDLSQFEELQTTVSVPKEFINPQVKEVGEDQDQDQDQDQDGINGTDEMDIRIGTRTHRGPWKAVKGFLGLNTKRERSSPTPSEVDAETNFKSLKTAAGSIADLLILSRQDIQITKARYIKLLQYELVSDKWDVAKYVCGSHQG